MKKTKTLSILLRHPSYTVVLLNKRGIPLLRDIPYINVFFKARLGYYPNLDNPQTFNEKLQWLKLHDRKPIYTTMVDKYEVKKYVADIIGKEHIIPTIGIYDKFDDINFDKLPNKFVIKCTHDSGGLVICNNKQLLNIEQIKKKIDKSLKRNYYYSGREWPYKNVKPRILIEQYMEDPKEKDLRDYKFFCFDGKVRCFKIDFNRFIKHQANYYDENGELLKFGEEVCLPDFNMKLKIPSNLNKMIRLAEKLSEGIPFVRIDFYSVENKVYFGEMTLYPAAGFGKFIPEEWDKKLGEMIDLDALKKKEYKNE